MNPIIIKFLKSLDDDELKIHFNQKPTEKTIGKSIPSPRSWEIVDNILSMNIKDDKELYMLIVGAVGKDTAIKFCTFRDKIKSLNLQNVFEKGFEVNLNSLNDSDLYDLCNQFITLVNNNFFNMNLGLIYKNVGLFLLFLIKNKKFYLQNILNKIDLSNDRLQSIFSMLKNTEHIDITNMILKEVL